MIVSYYLILFLGVALGLAFDWVIINYIYFNNIYLFMDLILTDKNKQKLIETIRKDYL